MNTKFPLSGIRVTDFSWYGAGPYVTRCLAAYGAEIIKIESATRIDAMRWYSPRKPDVEPSYNISGMYNNFNPGKLGITLNLNHAKSIEIVKKLRSLSITNFSQQLFFPLCKRLPKKTNLKYFTKTSRSGSSPKRVWKY